jgi:hypothetical protein
MSVFISDKYRSRSVRSTNVYEERSLGIYEDNTSTIEEDLSLSGNRVTAWGDYLAMHARKQLAFGMRASYVHSNEFVTVYQICGGLD